MELTDEQVDAALKRWIDFCVEYGVSCVFDAGLPGDAKFHEKVYKRLKALDEQGKLRSELLLFPQRESVSF